MPEITRRDFLKLTTAGLLTASGLLGLGGLLRFLGYQSEPPPKDDFELGPAANFPVGSRIVLADIPAVLLHTDSGFSALSLVCTHLGCTVEQKTDGWICLSLSRLRIYQQRTCIARAGSETFGRLAHRSDI
jgi:cytochrome b6-f complex iron-sulfur subunit